MCNATGYGEKVAADKKKRQLPPPVAGIASLGCIAAAARGTNWEGGG